MSSEYDEGYRAGLQKSRDVARPHIEAMEARTKELEAKLEKTAEKVYTKCCARGEYTLAQSCRDSILSTMKGKDDD